MTHDVILSSSITQIAGSDAPFTKQKQKQKNVHSKKTNKQTNKNEKAYLKTMKSRLKDENTVQGREGEPKKSATL